MGLFIVIGSAKPGIGEAVTRRILAQGHSVLGTYESEHVDTAKKLLDENKNIKLVELDHSNLVAFNEFIASVPKNIDGVAITQMFFDMRDSLEFDEDSWNDSITVNLTIPHVAALKLSKSIKPSGGIVTITSTEGFIGSFGAASYAATKAAIHNLIKTHANILGAKGVRVNAIAAGWIGGVMDTDEVFNMSRKITPLGRLGDPVEIANVAWFLLSDQSTFVTGATIVADGGYTCVDTIAKFEYEAFAK